MEKTTLCYIEQNDCYLMLHKTRKGDMNVSKYLGIGGHFEKNETPNECILREVKEETNLTLLDYSLRGILLFENNDYKEMIYLYTSSSFTGNIKKCSEGDLVWVKKDDVINLNIWEGDKVFLKLLKDNKPYFILKLKYDNNKFIGSELQDDIPEVYKRS